MLFTDAYYSPPPKREFSSQFSGNSVQAEHNSESYPTCNKPPEFETIVATYTASQIVG